MIDENIWNFDYNPQDYRGRRVVGTYQALLDHASEQSNDEIEDFDFDKLDDAVRLPIMYATMLHNDWRQLSQDFQPTFEEFRTALDHPDFDKLGWYAGMDKPEKLGFVAKPIPAVRLPNLAGMPGLSGIGVLNDGLNALGVDTDKLRDRAVNGMKTRMREALRRAKASRGVEEVFSSGDDDGNSKMNYSGGTAVNPTGLSLNNKPVRVSFKTDIEIGGEPKFYLDGKEETSPLIMKTGLPGLVSATSDTANLYFDPQVYNWLSGPITNTWIAKLQSQIVWTNQIADVITNKKVVKYFNYLMTSLYIYFFYTSTIAYTSDSRNRNAGLYAIRDSMTASDYVELSMLKLNIQQSLIPPFIMRMCHYFSGNFKQSMDPGTPIIRLLPWMMKFGTGNEITGIAQQITFPNGETYSALQYANRLMRDGVVRDITAVLARSYPSWMDQEPMGYESLPEYDPDFVTFFNNMAYVTMSSGNAVEYLPEVTSTNDTIAFNTYSDAPDGWITSMLSIRDNQSGKQSPGLCGYVLPRTDSDEFVNIISNNIATGGNIQSTEFIYATHPSSTGTSFWPTCMSRDFAELVSNTYQAGYSGTGSFKFQRFGTGRLNFVNSQIIVPRVLQMLELIFTSDICNTSASGAKPGQIGTSGRRRGRGKGGNSERSKGKGRNKSKTNFKKEDIDVSIEES